VSGPLLRAAVPADLPAIRALVADAGLPLAGLPACVLAGTAVVAVEDGRLIGTAATERHGTAALLRSLAVDPGARGRGLGRALVDRALADASDAGAHEAWLLTETAEGWFAARGWQVVDRAAAPPAIAASVEFASACPTTAVAMCRAR
jgi:amino-acid N-acetyltransferase